MARKYTHVKVLEQEIIRLKMEGKTRREIAEMFDLTKDQVKGLVKRHNRAKKLAEAGVLPRRKGRPPKGYQATEQDKDNEIKRLKMENELLRDFLRHGGRR